MKAAGVVLALLVALVLQTTVSGLTFGGTTAVNLVLVAVIYAALALGPVPGLVAGSIGGLIQDALAGGIVGVGGFSKTLVGFVVGLLGAQFIVAQWFPRLVMFFGGTIIHELCYQALYALVESGPFRMRWSATLTEAAINALIGVFAFYVIDSGPGMMQRRRARGATLSRRRY